MFGLVERRTTNAKQRFVFRKYSYALQRIKGFHRIRHYGLLANAARVENLARARELLAAPLSPLIAVPVLATEDIAQDTPAENTRPCPCCGAPMVIIETFAKGHGPRAPPSAMGQAA